MNFYALPLSVSRNNLFYKLFIVMKLTTFLLLITLVQVQASSFAQRISLSRKDASLTDVFKQIRSQSGYDFVYNIKAVKKVNNIDVNFKNTDLHEALQYCFAGTQLTYEILDRTIVVKEQQKSLLQALAPPVDIKGKITDQKGMPLIGATVKSKNSNKATVTNVNGDFELSGVDDGDVIVVSYLGFISREIPANSRSGFDITLNEDLQAMNEVVVVGYGTQKKENLTGAVAQISSADIGYHPTPDIANSLQGLLPGLNIQANTGNPGDRPDINIRGFNSINGGSPLILIDGIQGDIDRVNPLDVDKVTVLKDAASAAIYGARGAFGVILITTKKGKEGDVVVNYTNNFAATTPIVRTDYIDDPYVYGKTIDAAIYGYNGTTYTGFTSDADYDKLKQVADGSLAPFSEKQADGTYKFYDKTNWYDMLFRKWQPSQTHNISISGGSDKVRAYLSGRTYKVGTIQSNVDADMLRYNIKGNLNFKANKWLELSDNIQVSTGDMIEYAGSKAGYANTGIYNGNTYYFLFPFMPSSIDGVPYDYNGYGEIAALQNRDNYAKTYSEQFVNTISARITPMENLVFNVDYSNTVNHAANSVRENPITYLTTTKATLSTVGLNTLTEARNRNYYNALNIYGTYSRKLFNENHNVKLLLGYNQEDFNADNTSSQQGGLLVSSLASLNLGTNLLQATSSGSIWAIQGYFGRLNYDYKNKYLLEVNGRYDGSSRFPEVSRYGFFPSVSAGWYVSEEKFFEPVKKIVSSLKLRSSYGKLGNQNIDLYTFAQILSTGQTGWLSNGSRLNYASVPAPLPSVVSWENSKTIDFGGDFGFFKNRLTASFDWYEKNISGMYVPGQPLPGVFGAPEPKENIASLRDRGFELSVSYNSSINLKGSPLHIRTTANLYNFNGVITKYPNPSGLMSTFYERPEARRHLRVQN